MGIVQQVALNACVPRMELELLGLDRAPLCGLISAEFFCFSTSSCNYKLVLRIFPRGHKLQSAASADACILASEIALC